MPESRKNSKPENYRKKPQNPTCRVHALLACVLLCQTLWLWKTCPQKDWRNYCTKLWLWQQPKNFWLTKMLAFQRQNINKPERRFWKNWLWPKNDNANESNTNLQTQFARTKAKKKTSQFWEPTQTNHEQSRSHETKPIKTTADQNADKKPWSQF